MTCLVKVGRRREPQARWCGMTRVMESGEYIGGFGNGADRPNPCS